MAFEVGENVEGPQIMVCTRGLVATAEEPRNHEMLARFTDVDSINFCHAGEPFYFPALAIACSVGSVNSAATSRWRSRINSAYHIVVCICVPELAAYRARRRPAPLLSRRPTRMRLLVPLEQLSLLKTVVPESAARSVGVPPLAHQFTLVSTSKSNSPL